MKFSIRLKLFFITLITYLLLFLFDYTVVNYLLDIISTSNLVHFYILIFIIVVINPFIAYFIVRRFKYEEDSYTTDVGKDNYMKREVKVNSFKDNNTK